MVNLGSSELDLLFYALSDPTRRRILSMMGERTQTISELAHPFKMSLAAVSKHIKILERARLLTRRRLGRMHECTLNASALKSAEDCIEYYTQFWRERLDVFARDLETPTRSVTKTARKK